MRILIAIDIADQDKAAIRLGVELMRMNDGEATVLTVVRREAERSAAQIELNRMMAGVKTAVSAIQARVCVGHPADKILRELSRGAYDLLVIGQRPYHNRWLHLLGTTGEQVTAHAPCSVLVAKGNIRPIQRILLCDSGSANPTLLSRLLVRLGALINADTVIAVLHVMSQMIAAPGIPGWQLRADAEELIREQTLEGAWLQRDLQVLEKVKTQPRPLVRHGLVVDEILAEAQRGDYDLIVIGAHQNGGWQRFLLDDLAHQIVVQLDRPVLVVR